MTTRTTPPPDGTPCWAELAVPDLDAARAFYGELFGWDWQIGPAETGFYSQALVQGRPAVALNGYRPDPDAPVQWLTFLAAADAAATADRAVTAGAHLLAGPMAVMDAGVMAVLRDPSGALVALWQAGTSLGAEVVDEPGALAWSEHMSDRPAAAREFYPALFGLDLQDSSAPGLDSTTLVRGEEPVAGIGGGAERPEWALFLAVADTDTIVATAQRLGADVHLAPEDSSYGRLAGITGPFGERFWVMGPVPEDGAAAATAG